MNRLLRFIRFGLVGLLCALIYFSVLHIAVKLWAFPVFWGSAVAFGAGIPVSYVGNRILTYHSTNGKPAEFGRYLVTQAANLVFTSLVVAFVTDLLGFPLFVGALVSFIVAPCVTFLMFEIWVYRQSTNSTKGKFKQNGSIT